MKPTIFIGSSSEAISVVDAFQSHLEDVAEVIPWRYGVFKSGESTLESLLKALNRFDFAALILTPDDLVESRGGTSSSPRDNVIFEIGLFIGRLGRERVFIVSPVNSRGFGLVWRA
jgi:predicted nucleotide-binding protein